MAVIDSPSRTVEVMCFTSPRPATASSTRRVTWVSSSDGAAPGCWTVTTTAGRSRSGVLLIRNPGKATSPARVSSTNSITVGIGLRIDQAEMLR